MRNRRPRGNKQPDTRVCGKRIGKRNPPATRSVRRNTMKERWTMLRRHLLPCLLVCIGGIASAAYCHAMSADLERLENEYKKALLDDRPRKAIEILERMTRKALSLGEKTVAAAACIRRLNTEAGLKRDGAAWKIEELEKIIRAGTYRGIDDLLEMVLARWYIAYYEANKYRLDRRTPASSPEEEGKDVRTWSKRRLLARITKIYDSLVERLPRLHHITIAAGRRKNPLISAEGAPADLYPTMADFAAREMLDFFSRDDLEDVLPPYAFVLRAESDAFGPLEHFLEYEPDTRDTSSPVLKTIRIHQKLMRLHRKAGMKDALLKVELERLSFVHEHAVGSAKDEIYRKRLEELTRTFRDSAYVADAWYALASFLHEKGLETEALAAARKGAAIKGKGHGADNCLALIETIELPSLRLETEKFAARGSALPVRIIHKNIRRIYLCLYRLDFESLMKKGRLRDTCLDRNMLSSIINSSNPIRSVEVELPPTPDYKEHEYRTSIEVARSGQYLLVASDSPKPTFWNMMGLIKKDPRLLLYSRFQCGPVIATVKNGMNEKIAGHLFDATTGKPIEGIPVTAYETYYDSGERYRRIATTRSDSEGAYELKVRRYRSIVVIVGEGDERTVAGTLYVSGHGYSASNRLLVQIFTDRAVYRPGQDVKFKIIAMRAYDPERRYEVIGDEKVEVILRDVNRKVVGRLSGVTNSFGSFSGSLAVPASVMPGWFTLEVRGPSSGYTRIRVEEYKRPSFKVTLSPPTTSCSVGDTVVLRGKAFSYTGVPIDGATVAYSVMRKVNRPWWWGPWCRWFYDFTPGSTQKIVSGRTRTAPDGTFEIVFDALPDPKLEPGGDFTLTYRVEASVTAPGGETHSADLAVVLGWKDRKIVLHRRDTLFDSGPVEFDVSLQTLTGEGVAGKLEYSILRLKQPSRVHRSDLFGPSALPGAPADMSEYRNWKEGAAALHGTIATGRDGRAVISGKLPPGAYKLVVRSRDGKGRPIEASSAFIEVDPAAHASPVKVPFLAELEKETVEAGQPLKLLFLTGYAEGGALLEIEHRGRVVKSVFLPRGRTQYLYGMNVPERFKGGFTLHLTFVKDGRCYTRKWEIFVPWSDKKLTLRFETFRSELRPGGRERWIIHAEGADGATLKERAELLAAMYDESLDTFARLNWPSPSAIFPRYRSIISLTNPVGSISFTNYSTPFGTRHAFLSYQRPAFRRDIVSPVYAHRFLMCRAMGMRLYKAKRKGGGLGAMAEENLAGLVSDEVTREGAAMPARSAANKAADTWGTVSDETRKTLETVKARKELGETAFFLPHLLFDSDGDCRIEFTMPDTLGGWNFKALAHTPTLRWGTLAAHAVTRKPLMLRPNLPRFLREGDSIVITARIVNQSGRKLTGAARLSLTPLEGKEDLCASFGLTESERLRAFEVEDGRSVAVEWKLHVPFLPSPVVCRMVAAAGNVSDGEENVLPVLTDKIRVVDSMPLSIDGKGRRRFSFTPLARLGGSKRIRSVSLTLQVVSNPAWYAVMALPYLMEYPYECSEQLFNRIYANSLGMHLLARYPVVARVFERWKRGGRALESPLAKNEALKESVLSETPWVRDAEDETEARYRVALLMDRNRMERELERARKKLEERRSPEGAWSWFPGGRDDPFITMYIVAGYGKLRDLGVDIDVSDAVGALSYMDRRCLEQPYRRLKAAGLLDRDNLTHDICMYLYARSFFIGDRPIPPRHRQAWRYYLSQAKRYWTSLASPLSRANLCLALHRLGEESTARRIAISLKEHTTCDDELGRRIEIPDCGWYWWSAPLETQAALIEVFDKVLEDPRLVDECQKWLLKHKQTNAWKTTKSTADVVYALLAYGADKLSGKAVVKARIGGELRTPARVESGTGFYEIRIPGPEVTPRTAEIELEKEDRGVAWGGVHWTYLAPLDMIQAQQGGMKLSKSIMVQRESDRGKVLVPLRKAGPLHPGDVLKIRLVLETDRRLEYVHLKDMRPAGAEPLETLSGYRWQDGLGYYQATRDTATHFFIDAMPPGTYVFEYGLRVNLKGRYETGMASIRCMYAPEFSAHSGSFTLEVE